MRVKDDVRKILFTASRDLSKLLYDKNGHFKKGINKTQRRHILRTRFFLFLLRLDDANGKYVMKGNKGDEYYD